MLPRSLKPLGEVDLLSTLIWCAAWLAGLMGVGWSCGAILWDFPYPRWRKPLVALILATILALTIFGPTIAPFIGMAMVIGIVGGWWETIEAQANREWADDVAIAPTVEWQGERFTVRHLRNFDYPDGDAKPVVRREDRSYDLSDLKSLDFFVSYWAGRPIAHTMASFGFGDGEYLTFSVEIRKEKSESYNPLGGLYRQYELFHVIGDERDIIRLRTNIRNEDVYLYRVRTNPQSLRAILLDYLNRAQALAEQPTWYNLLTSNCTTNLFQIEGVRLPGYLRLGLLLNGYSDLYAYNAGFLSDHLPFQQLREQSAISDLAKKAGDAADFSARIRERLVLPQPRKTA